MQEPRSITLASDRMRVLAVAALIIAAPVLTFLYMRAFLLNHDVAWLLVATQRWVAGEALYRDIVEINPPLIFFVNIALTAGLLTKSAYLAGTTLVIAISGLWVLFARGPQLALFSVFAMVFAGWTDYGQRDHLALIFLIPYLASGRDGGPAHWSAGVWAFFGVGLKPHFAIIPIAFTIGECIRCRSVKPALATSNLVLLGLCLAWLCLAALAWPIYFTKIIPLARLTYDALGFPPLPAHHASLALMIGLAGLAWKRSPNLFPLACAAIGAFAEFYLQGRFWPYQFVPPMGIMMLFCLAFAWEGRRSPIALIGIVAIILALRQLLFGPHRYPPPFVFQGISPVLILSERVSAAYPQVLECGVVNASRYPSLWTLPGVWNRIHRSEVARPEARKQFQSQVNAISADIRRFHPKIIFEDLRPTYFAGNFAYSDWLDLSNYKRIAVDGRYAIWLRIDLSPLTIEAPYANKCTRGTE